MVVELTHGDLIESDRVCLDEFTEEGEGGTVVELEGYSFLGGFDLEDPEETTGFGDDVELHREDLEELEIDLG